MVELPDHARHEKVRVAFSSLLAAIFLTIIKLVVGIVTMSLGMLSEAAHSALDLGAAGVTYFAVKVSDKPADSEHHYGHGKIENLSALIEAILLLITCAWIIFESVKRLFFKSVEIKVPLISFVVLIISILINYSRAKVLSRTAKKYESQALEADALHFQSDIYSSLVVIVGLFFVKVGLPVADPIAALGVAALVLYASVELSKKTVDVLLDRAPDGLEHRVKEVVEKIPEINSISRLRLRKAGSHYFLDMNIRVKKDSSLENAHQITTQIEENIASLLPNSDVIVHTEPDEGGGFLKGKAEILEGGPDEKKIVADILNQHFNEFVEFHDLVFTRSGNSRFINLHLVMPKDIKIEDAHKLCDHLEHHIKSRLGQSKISIHIEPCEGDCDDCKQVCEYKRIKRKK
jgi:cation diffusion facilitator family transporter